MVPKIDSVIQRLRAAQVASGMSRADFALACGLSMGALLTMDEPGWAPKVETIRAIESWIERGSGI